MKRKIVLATAALAMVIGNSAFAASSNDYIVLLPKINGVEYDLDKDHVADEYCSDNYTVLLYNPGETVDFEVTGGTKFTILDTLENDSEDYAKDAKDGKVSFTMPSEDLTLAFVKEDTDTEETDNPAETESNSETASEETISTEETANKETLSVSSDDSNKEAETDAVTESKTEKDTEPEAAVEETETESTENSEKTVVKTTARLNCRTDNNMNAEYLGTFPIGTELTVVGEKGNWYEVDGQIDGKDVHGFVSKNFCTK